MDFILSFNEFMDEIKLLLFDTETSNGRLSIGGDVFQLLVITFGEINYYRPIKDRPVYHLFTETIGVIANGYEIRLDSNGLQHADTFFNRLFAVSNK